MLDAGHAREYTVNKYIPYFESPMIRKLLESPHYLGRGYINRENREKYIKNKKICDLVDKLRYGTSRKLPYIKQEYANLKCKGYDIFLDGGSAICDPLEELDLGDAYSPQIFNRESNKYDLGNASQQKFNHKFDLGDSHPPKKYSEVDLGDAYPQGVNHEINKYDLDNAYQEGHCELVLGNSHPPKKHDEIDFEDAYPPRKF